MAPIAEVCEVNPRLRKKLAANDMVAFVGMSGLDATSAIATDSEQRPYADVAKAYTSFEHGDVLVAKITPCFENGKIAQAAVSTKIAFGSTEFHVLRPIADRVDRRYLLHFLRRPSVLQLGEQRMTGAGGQRRVPARLFEELHIPLPLIEEQRRIAAVLDAADALRAKRRRALAKLDTLTQAIFIDMFGDPVSNPRGWPDERVLGDVAEVRSGFTKGRKVGPQQELTTVPYLAVVNVQDGHLATETLKTVDATADEIEKFALLPGDILLTEGGDPDKLGRGAVWDGRVIRCIHQNHIFRARVTAPHMTSGYLSALLGSSRGKKYFLRMAKQTTGIASINMSQLRSFPILEPPVDVQRRYLAGLVEVSTQKQLAAASLARLDALFASLQQRAFRGEL